MTERQRDSSVLLTRRKFGLGLAFLTVAGVAAARKPSANVDYLGKSQLEEVIPKQIGEWSFFANSGVVVPPEDQLVRATYSQLLTRAYTAEGQPPLMLLIAQSSSQSGILQIHRPEFCYTAGGFDITETELHPVPLGQRTLPALTLEARGNGRTEQIVFWTRIGDDLPSSWTEQKISVAMANLRGIIPDAALIRVSTYGADRKAALESIDHFIRSMLESVSPATRRALIA